MYKLIKESYNCKVAFLAECSYYQLIGIKTILITRRTQVNSECFQQETQCKNIETHGKSKTVRYVNSKRLGQ